MNKEKTFEYGDFQTPEKLVISIINYLISKNIQARTIIEPTCGIGMFIQHSIGNFTKLNKIIGIEIQKNYTEKIINREWFDNKLIDIKNANFFDIDWDELICNIPTPLLIIGNPPWITNTELSKNNSKNVPIKSNKDQLPGIKAITGDSNFDIAESIIITLIDRIHMREASIAVICKLSVARKVLIHCWKKSYNTTVAEIHEISAKHYFNASVDACILIIQFDTTSDTKVCQANVFSTAFFKISNTIIYENDILISNYYDYQRYKHLLSFDTKNKKIKWRSGIKHDLANIMELYQKEGRYYNKLNELVDIEETLIYPLLKSSDLNKGKSITKYVIVTQRTTGQDTNYIKFKYPKTWKYLNDHISLFNRRKSKIYKNKPRFAIFGVGPYSFNPWKIAISALHKDRDLNFIFLPYHDNKPVMLDDTCYFISFESEDQAKKVYQYLLSDEVKKIMNSMISWEDKRPIKTRILNLLDINDLI